MKTLAALLLAVTTLDARQEPDAKEREKIAREREKELYKLGPESQYQEGVPKGTITKYHWVSQIFAKTERDYWVYVPSQYDKEKPTALMVFQDGGGYQNPTGGYRVPVVFDNLIN